MRATNILKSERKSMQNISEQSEKRAKKTSKRNAKRKKMHNKVQKSTRKCLPATKKKEYQKYTKHECKLVARVGANQR